MVQLWLPVVALIYLLVTRSVLSIYCRIEAHGLLESSSTDDSMDVCGNGPWADDGVASVNCQRLAVNCEDLAMGELDQGQTQGREQSRVKRRHGEELAGKKLGTNLKGW